MSIKDTVLKKGRLYTDITSMWRTYSMMLYQGYVGQDFFDNNKSYLPQELENYKDFFRVEETDINGVARGYRRKHTINLTKLVSNHIRTLIMNEGYDLKIKSDIQEGEDEKARYIKRDYFQSVLKNNNFNSMEGELLEWSIASGDNLKLVWFDANETEETKKPKISFIKGNKFIITEHDNGNVKGVITTTTKVREEEDKKKVNTVYYTLLEHHKLDGGTYKINREIYQSDKRNHLDSIVAYKSNCGIFGKIESSEIESFDVGEGMFVYTRMPFSNNKDTDSIRGLGITVNALNEMDAVNTAFDAETQEVNDTKAKLIIPENWIESYSDENGNTVKHFNQNTRVFMGVKDDDRVMDKPFVFAPPLRANDYEKLIENNSKRFAKSCNLDPSHFSLTPTSKTTATQVKIDNKASHDLRQEIVHVLEDKWVELLWIIYKYGKHLGVISWDLQKEDIEISFPDGIIEDDKELFERDLRMLEKGILSKSKVRKKWANMNDKESETEEEIIEKEQRFDWIVKAVTNKIIDIETAQKLWFGDDDINEDEYQARYLRTLKENALPMSQAEQTFIEQKDRERLAINTEEVLTEDVVTEEVE